MMRQTRARTAAVFVALAIGAWALALSCNGSRVPLGPGKSGEVVQLKVKGQTVKAEIACDDVSRRIGLMDRPSLPEDVGMLFIFPEVRQQSFWMKNTLIPLSIAFLDDDGKILQIEDMKVKDLSSTLSKYLVRYALEVNKGWFERHGLKPGDACENFRAATQRFKAR